MDTPGYYENNKIKICLMLGLLFLALFGIYLRWLGLDNIYINQWVTRDFDRAFN